MGIQMGMCMRGWVEETIAKLPVVILSYRKTHTKLPRKHCHHPNTLPEAHESAHVMSSEHDVRTVHIGL